LSKALLLTRKKRQRKTKQWIDGIKEVLTTLTSTNVNMQQATDCFYDTKTETHCDIFIINCQLTEEYVQMYSIMF